MLHFLLAYVCVCLYVHVVLHLHVVSVIIYISNVYTSMAKGAIYVGDIAEFMKPKSDDTIGVLK